MDTEQAQTSQTSLEGILRRMDLNTNHREIGAELLEHANKLKELINTTGVYPDHKWDGVGEFMTHVGMELEKKRLFICCDGTRNNASGTVDPLTNVAKLARAVHRTGDDKYNVPTNSDVIEHYKKDPEAKRFGSVRQIVYYSSGVGARSALGTDSLYASAFGKGLSANLLDAYCFICNNFNGRSLLDELILVGFSRGAYTVRCLARFINDIGLLRKSGLVFLQTIYKLWRDNAGYEPAEWLPEWQWPSTYRDLKNTRKALSEFFVWPGAGEKIKIKVLAEWDTVSALGLWANPLSFVGNKVPENVEHAFLAVSLHEKRQKFGPMLWDSEENRETKTNIKQCIFAGCHSDIGGGNPDPALSSASFFWMIGQIKESCKARFSHERTTLQYAIPLQLERKRWPWKRPPMCLHIQSFAKGRVNESRRGWYAVPYWLSLTMWDGKRDWLWEIFSKSEGGTAKELKKQKKHPVELKTHITVRLLYEHRFRTPAVEKGDKRLRCGFFSKYKPEKPEEPADPEDGHVPRKPWRWVKRDSQPKAFLEEEDMVDSEKKLFRNLFEQAKAIDKKNSGPYWNPDTKLEDKRKDTNWTKINRALKWVPIVKDCSFEDTFISLLDEVLETRPTQADSHLQADAVVSERAEDDLESPHSATKTEPRRADTVVSERAEDDLESPHSSTKTEPQRADSEGRESSRSRSSKSGI